MISYPRSFEKVGSPFESRVAWLKISSSKRIFHGLVRTSYDNIEIKRSKNYFKSHESR